jgi:hypothetical protein
MRRESFDRLNIWGIILMLFSFVSITAALSSSNWYEIRGPVIGHIGLQKLCVEHALELPSVEPVMPGCWNIDIGLQKIANSPKWGGLVSSTLPQALHDAMVGLIISAMIAFIACFMHVLSMHKVMGEKNSFWCATFAAAAFTTISSLALAQSSSGKWGFACFQAPPDPDCVAFNEALEIYRTDAVDLLVIVPIIVGFWIPVALYNVANSEN